MQEKLHYYRLYGRRLRSLLCVILLAFLGTDVHASSLGAVARMAYAQPESFIIRGRVTGNDAQPLSGVNVINLRTKKGISTNDGGNFSIQAGPGDEIEFRYIGFMSQRVKVTANKKDLKIVLQVDSKVLSETVVTALGIKRELKALSYAYSEVKGEDTKKARESNVINSLAGKVPGLIINSTAGGPAGSSRVIIRGNTSITGNNQPLYVVDGIPIDNSNYGQVSGSKYGGGEDLGDAISAINPDDIETISVLKGPSASALYGTRAANGVIMITMKKGTGKKEFGIELNSSSTFESQLTTFDGYQHLYGQGARNSIPLDANQARTTLFSNFGGRLDAGLMVPSYDGTMRPYSLQKDNISGFFNTGRTFTNTLSLSNATDKTSYRLSATNLTNRDIVPKSKFQRNSFTFNGTAQLGKRLKMETKAFYMNEKVNNRPAMADDPSNIGSSFVGLANNVNQSYFADAYKTSDGTYLEWGGGQYRINPYWVINEMRNKTQKDRLLATTQANLTLTDWLNIQGRISTDLTFLDYEKFSPRTTPGALSGRLDTRNQRYSTTEADVLITAQKQLSESWNVSARLGGSISRSQRPGTAGTFINMAMTDVISPISFSDSFITPLAPFKRSLNSFYGLFSGSYKDYLYLDASIRRDASSTLPEANNSYWYPSVGASFIFSDAFKIDNSILSFGKVRASAAEVGSDTDPYQLDLYYGLNQIPFEGNSVGQISGVVKPNRNLKPTRTRSYEFGTELKFLKNRIGLDVTYYNSRSRDQINQVPIPYSSGFNYRIVNAGVIANKGVEILLSGKPLVSRKWNWDLSFNFARNINKVESLADDMPFLTLSDARWMGVSVVAKPGATYGSILAYDYRRDPNGNIILNPNNLTPLESDERTVVGKGVFDWTGGFVSNLRFKNFGLNTIIDIKQGADMFSMSNLFAAIRGSLTSTLEGREEWIKSDEQRQAAGKTEQEWEAMGMTRGLVPKGVVASVDGNGNTVYTENTKAVNPGVYWPAIYTDGNGVAGPYIYNAGYIKVREIGLSYTFPQAMLAKWKISAMSLTLISRNPFIISKHIPNVDPDSNYNNGNGQGFEYGSLPSRRSWGVNVNIRF